MSWFAVLAACSSEGTLVGATLDDGQILVGEITTDVLQLKGHIGEIEVPLEDVGMLLPVERRTLADSHNNVTVWLRNGSELNGEWAAPELSMAIAAGGRSVSVDLPTGRLQTLQLRGSESWPDRDLFRVRTIWGDDLLVDPEETALSIDSDLGRFDLLLSECTHVGPVGSSDGAWRATLTTGTVLIGKPSTELRLVPPMGPDEVVVPLDGLVSLTRGGWTEDQALLPVAAAVEAMPEAATPIAADPAYGNGMDLQSGELGELREAKAKAAPRAGLSSSDGWFRNERIMSSKH